jgi:hypothetical protein
VAFSGNSFRLVEDLSDPASLGLRHGRERGFKPSDVEHAISDVGRGRQCSAPRPNIYPGFHAGGPKHGYAVMQDVAIFAGVILRERRWQQSKSA